MGILAGRVSGVNAAAWLEIATGTLYPLAMTRFLVIASPWAAKRSPWRRGRRGLLPWSCSVLARFPGLLATRGTCPRGPLCQGPPVAYRAQAVMGYGSGGSGWVPAPSVQFGGVL